MTTVRNKRPHVYDEGTKIVLDVGLDISDSTVRKIKYVKPNGGKSSTLSLMG